MHSGVVTRAPGADYPESEDAIPRTKEEESMADRIQQAAQSGSHQPDQNQPGEEFDLAAPKPKLNIPDYENYDSVDARFGEQPTRPKAAACPPQQEQAAIKRQASGDAQLQAPPSQFLIPEEQKQKGGQRLDPAKKSETAIAAG